VAHFEDDVQGNASVLHDLQEPPGYRVLIHNDDYTTMEFVVEVLEAVFHKGASEATQIMLNVHREGIGVCGIYPFEIAETKITMVRQMAESAGFPLLCTMEEE